MRIYSQIFDTVVSVQNLAVECPRFFPEGQFSQQISPKYSPVSCAQIFLLVLEKRVFMMFDILKYLFSVLKLRLLVTKSGLTESTN